MNRLEHLLTISGEECNEVAQRASKALRFGLHQSQPGQAFNNAERIRQEFVDLVATLGMVEEEAGLPAGTLTAYRPIEISAKQERIERYLLLSRKEGTLLCQARQCSDQMVCEPCALRWDVNDAQPPRCQPTGRQ